MENNDKINKERIEKFKKLGIPINERHISLNNIAISNMLKKTKNPNMLAKIDEIRQGKISNNEKMFFKEVMNCNSTPNKYLEKDKYLDRDRSIGLKNHIELESFNDPYSVLKNTSEAERFEEILIGSPKPKPVKPELSDYYVNNNSDCTPKLEDMLKEKMQSNKVNKEYIDKKLKDLEKDYGTYYTKLYEAKQKEKEEIKIKDVVNKKENILIITLNKVKSFWLQKITLIKNIWNSKIEAFKNWKKGLSIWWANYKLKLILSEKQIELLNELSIAKAPTPKTQEEIEAENLPRMFNKLSKNKNFNYNKMRNLNERMIQIPE